MLRLPNDPGARSDHEAGLHERHQGPSMLDRRHADAADAPGDNIQSLGAAVIRWDGDGNCVMADER